MQSKQVPPMLPSYPVTCVISTIVFRNTAQSTFQYVIPFHLLSTTTLNITIKSQGYQSLCQFFGFSLYLYITKNESGITLNISHPGFVIIFTAAAATVTVLISSILVLLHLIAAYCYCCSPISSRGLLADFHSCCILILCY